MESSLAERDGTTNDIREKNRIRTMIKSYFQKRECCTLIRPIDDDIKLQKLDSTCMKPAYKDQFASFKELALSMCAPKSVGASVLNGSSFLRLVDYYVGSINKGGIPVIEDAWRDVARREIDAHLISHIDTFKKEIKTVCSTFKGDEDFLMQEINKIKHALSVSFKEKCRPYGVIDKYVIILKTEYRKAVSNSISELTAKSKKEMLEYLNTIYLTAFSIKEYKNPYDFIADVKKIRALFMDKCRLKCRSELWDEYMFDKLMPLLEQCSMRDDNKRSQFMEIKDKEIETLKDLIKTKEQKAYLAKFDEKTIIEQYCSLKMKLSEYESSIAMFQQALSEKNTQVTQLKKQILEGKRHLLGEIDDGKSINCSKDQCSMF